MKCVNVFLCLIIFLGISCSDNTDNFKSLKVDSRQENKRIIDLSDKKPNDLVALSTNTKYNITTINGLPDSKDTITLKGFATFYIRGWAVDINNKKNAGGVFVVIDNVKYFNALYGNPKPGVAKLLGSQDYINSEFELRIPLTQIGKGIHTLYLAILTNDGKSYYRTGKRLLKVQ